VLVLFFSLCFSLPARHFLPLFVTVTLFLFSCCCTCRRFSVVLSCCSTSFYTSSYCCRRCFVRILLFCSFSITPVSLSLPLSSILSPVSVPWKAASVQVCILVTSGWFTVSVCVYSIRCHRVVTTLSQFSTPSVCTLSLTLNTLQYTREQLSPVSVPC
jgi:hypothetical protein